MGFRSTPTSAVASGLGCKSGSGSNSSSRKIACTAYGYGRRSAKWPLRYRPARKGPLNFNGIAVVVLAVGLDQERIGYRGWSGNRLTDDTRSLLSTREMTREPQTDERFQG